MSGEPSFPIVPEAARVLDRLWSAGFAAYLVGGAVRDALLGRPSHDWDVATDARPDRLLQLFPTGTYENRFGTVLVDGVEVTTFRRDHQYADHRRPDRVEFTDDLEEDLVRRDFTVNAIAWGRGAGSLPAAAGVVDPTGGQADLAAGLLRAVGDADRRFDEDALRLLRAARLAATVGLTIEAGTLAAMGRHAADARWVSPERLGAELRRIVDAPTPSVGLGVLTATGILEVAYPELAAADLVMAGGVLDRLAGEDGAGGPDEAMRLAVLVVELPARGPEGARSLFRRLATPTRTVDRAVAIVRAARLAEAAARSGVDAGRPGVDATEAMSTRRLVRDAGAGVVVDGLRLALVVAGARGDARGGSQLRRLADEVAAQLAADVPTTIAQLAVDGTDLMASLDRPGGPWLGTLLRRLLDAVVDDPRQNTRDALLGLAISLAPPSDHPRRPGPQR